MSIKESISGKSSLNLYSVIKNDGPPGTFFWKFQSEDFRTGSQIIVAENEEALFVREGVIVETFTGGRYSLTSNNYPFIDKVRAFFSGGENAFNCKVFFVSKVHALEMKWGTDSPIQVRDPVWRLSAKIQGRGSYSLKIADAKKFILKLVANNTQFVSQEQIKPLFVNVFLQKIKSAITKNIQESGKEILGICAELDSFAESLTPKLAPIFDEYGLELVNFYVGALDIPEDDPSRVKLENALANKNELNVLGGDWQRVQSRDILTNISQNEGSAGSIASLGAGMGMGFAAGGAFATIAAPAMAMNATPPATAQPQTPSAMAECPACHAALPAGAKFCSACGAKIEVKKKFCVACGVELSPSAKFCNECGGTQ